MRIIVNPQAGRGAGRRRLEELRKFLEKEKIEISVTRFPGEAADIAAQSVKDGVKRILVMGGDGTVGEAANGIYKSDVELAIIPVGTGNDIARSIGLPFSPREALRVAVRGNTKPFDLGWDKNFGFCSFLGVGFPAIVAEEANRLLRFKGPAAFFLGMYKSLIRMKPYPVCIEMDEFRYEGLCTSIMVQNTPYTGGGLFIAPDAQVDDGKLDVIIVSDISRLNLMVNFPRLYWGSHLSHPCFSAYRSRNVRITSDEPLRKILDGDLRGTTPVDLTVLQGALNVVVA